MKAHTLFTTFLVTGTSIMIHPTTAQDSCTAVAYSGNPSNGNSCTGVELGDASQDGAGFGDCTDVSNGACILTEASEGQCVFHLYRDFGCNTPISGGNTLACGSPPEDVNFNSFQVECA